MSKGSDAERELCSELWDRGYATLRAPGSGSIDRPSPDVLAIDDVSGDQFGKDRDILVFELKASSDGTARFSQDEIDALCQWRDRAQGHAYVGIRPDMRRFDQWLFRPVPLLHETETGYSIRQQDHDDCLGIDDL